MTDLLRAFLVILAIGTIVAIIIVAGDVDPESLQAWVIWLVAAAVALGASLKLVMPREPASH
jgi:hypothetical protein